jgi:restriction endonuclease Mrr
MNEEQTAHKDRMGVEMKWMSEAWFLSRCLTCRARFLATNDIFAAFEWRLLVLHNMSQGARSSLSAAVDTHRAEPAHELLTTIKTLSKNSRPRKRAMFRAATLREP